MKARGNTKSCTPSTPPPCAKKETRHRRQYCPTSRIPCKQAEESKRRRQRTNVDATPFIAQPLLEGITGLRSPFGGTRITWSLDTIVVVPAPCSPLCDPHLQRLRSSIFRCRCTSPSNFYGMNMHRPSSVPLPILPFRVFPSRHYPLSPTSPHQSASSHGTLSSSSTTKVSCTPSTTP